MSTSTTTTTTTTAAAANTLNKTKSTKISIQASDNKKSKRYTGEKAIPRCTSPSHFLQPEPAALTNTIHSQQRSNIDALLNSIGMSMDIHHCICLITNRYVSSTNTIL